MKKLTLSEYRELPFGTNIIVNYIGPCRNDNYKGVIIKNSIYYEDGDIISRYILEESIQNGTVNVYRI